MDLIILTHRGHRQQGVALIVVLASLVFLIALSIAFLLTSEMELKSSKSYAEGGRAELLSESAVNLAMAQITDATKGVDDSGNTLAWASQPGMIRTYDTAGNRGACFKLYSWDAMTSASGFDPLAATEKIPTGSEAWYNQKAIFTDLNEPVSGGTGNIYPIVDGNNLSDWTNPATGKTNKTYLSNGTPTISGFYVSKSDAPLSTAANANPVPMPVKWLYVLADGKIVAPSAGLNNTATFTGTNIPTLNNPIMGRLAFWTDDESAKVNINTASEGVYGDTPRVGYSVDDPLLEYNIAVSREYQRYPGHPATTSLSAVFANLLPSSDPASAGYTTYLNKIYGIAPRVGIGGSNGGTVKTTQGTPVSLNLDKDRLYASIDELMFKPVPLSGERPVTDSDTPAVIKRESLEPMKFFLTTSSRSSDLNLFGKPRVNIWPVHVNDSSNYRTPFDSTIAFCSTMRDDLGTGAYRFYFQRQDPTNPNTDLPTAGSTSGLGRNRVLLNYLKDSTSKNVPGFGASLQRKYSAIDAGGKIANATEMDQILTEVFDYIRCTNLLDIGITNPVNRYTPGVHTGDPSSGGWSNGDGQVIPIEDEVTGTRGFGRYRTVQGGNFLFIGQVDGDDDGSQIDSAGNALSPDNRVAPKQIRIQSCFIPQLFDVAVGTTFDNPQIALTITGLDSFTWDNGNGPVSMGFPASITPQGILNSFSPDGATYGDQLGRRMFLPYNLPNEAAKFISKTLDVAKNNKTIGFSGGDVKFTFKTVFGSPAKTVQTVVLRFPPGKFPLPDLADGFVQDNDDKGNVLGTYNLRYFLYTAPNPSTAIPAQGWGGRINAPRSHVPVDNWVFESKDVVRSDVVRSVYASPGDMRLVAVRKDLTDPGMPGYPYSKNAKYDDVSARCTETHTLWNGDGTPVPGAAVGRLVKDAPYDTYFAPVFSDTPLNGVAVGKQKDFAFGDVPGDWDTGVAEIRDGPYINKPDEGDMGAAPDLWPYKWKYHIGSRGVSVSLFTPNRQIPSAVTFGSLPTGVLANKPWQTLLFRPGPARHPGLGVPSKTASPAGLTPSPPYSTLPDHLLLDLFHMPVVEPYPISEPFSTAGRINMNYQIVPFTYINRDTGIRAVLKSEKVISIKTNPNPTTERGGAQFYKTSYSTTPVATTLQSVNLDETLKGFDERFNPKAYNLNNPPDIFRSASEICALDIVPKDYTGSSPHTRAGMDSYWSTRLLTGDNCREHIYATVYPRLTTQSNTFTVHFRAQALKKVTGSRPDIWDESKDQITSERRGSETAERYIDPNNNSIPDYALPATTTAISSFYKFRVVQAKIFAP